MEAPADNHQFQLNSATSAEPAAFAAAPLRLAASTLSNALPFLAIAAFAHGFFGGLIGGIAYSLAPSWLQLRELPFAAVSIPALATILGSFEVWRAAQVRPPAFVRARLLFVLVACLVVLLSVAGFIAALAPPSEEKSIPVRVSLRRMIVC